MNDFFTAFLAQIFEKFKAKNPMVAAGIILAALTVSYFADNGTALGLFTLPVWLAPVLKWVGLFAAGLVGSRTTVYLPPPQRAEREADYQATLGKYFGDPSAGTLQDKQAKDLERARSDIRGDRR